MQVGLSLFNSITFFLLTVVLQLRISLMFSKDNV